MRILLYLCFIFFCNNLQAQFVDPFHPDKRKPPKKKNGLKLVWADEFNYKGKPDSLFWKYERGFVRNKELQWYSDKNAYCNNGVLVIEGKRELLYNPAYDSLSNNWKQNRKYAEYTSSSIITRDFKYFRYGRFEIRARIDTSNGLWPAIWTLGKTGIWPQNGEIDLMEFYRIENKPYIFANTAWGAQKKWTAKWNSKRYALTDIMGKDTLWHKKFHIWHMDWNKDSICIYLDNKLLNTTYLAETINPDGFNPFRQPHYILLNLAIGQNGGNPEKTNFPVKYEVDYVRVYQNSQKKKEEF